MARTRSYKKGYTNYNYSSSAYAYEPASLPYFKEEQKRLAEEKARKDKLLATAVNKKTAAHKLKLTIAVLIVFAGCFVIMASSAAVARQRIANSKLKDELVALKSENTTLQAEISDSVDLDYIKKEATERLGMTEPQPYQIIYIDVPKQSYNVQYSNSEVQEDDGFSFKKMLEMFKK